MILGVAAMSFLVVVEQVEKGEVALMNEVERTVVVGRKKAEGKESGEWWG